MYVSIDERGREAGGWSTGGRNGLWRERETPSFAHYLCRSKVYGRYMYIHTHLCYIQIRRAPRDDARQDARILRCRSSQHGKVVGIESGSRGQSQGLIGPARARDPSGCAFSPSCVAFGSGERYCLSFFFSFQPTQGSDTDR